MAGLYLHIPFCKQKCSYCDFHFSTSFKHKEALLQAIELELKKRSSEITGPIQTIYFGGGTPSVLSDDELTSIMDSIHNVYEVEPEPEITLECNPDDIDKQALKAFKQVGINRLSIGVQSFRNEDLELFNRSHNSEQAKSAIQMAQDMGLTNITIDLIYGIPGLKISDWENNLNAFIDLDLPHLSAYTLTVEPKTELQHLVKQEKLFMPADQLVIDQFKLLKKYMHQAGLDHYEISNFGKPGFYSKHNSNYWKGVPYLGIGPSAHSYNGQQRSWNIANNVQYIKALQEGISFSETEQINEQTAYNEYVMTGLRTKWGIHKKEIADQFNPEIVAHFEKELSKLEKTSYLQIVNDTVVLTEEGMTVADGIAAELFYL